MVGAREVAMITDCFEKFSARRNWGGRKCRRFEENILSERKTRSGERIGEKILVGTIHTGFIKSFYKRVHVKE